MRDVAHGLDSKFCAEAIEHYFKLLKWIEQATLDHDYLAGNDFSLADIAVIPYVICLDLLRLSSMWQSYAALPKWYERVRRRPAVERAIMGSMTETDKAPFAEIGFDPWPGVSQRSRTKQ